MNSTEDVLHKIEEITRCYRCVHFKPVGRGHSGWCQDAKPKIRVNAVDYCDHAEKKEEVKP